MKVISDIQQMTISKPLPQGEINNSFAWLMTYLENNEDDDTNLEPTEEAIEHRKDAIKAYGVSENQVKQRRCYILPEEEINSIESQGPILFPNFPETSSLNMAERMDIFRRVVDQLILDYYENSDMPDHIIHVSNSGYSSPSAVQKMVSLKGWNSLVTNCYHMGCYAAFPAVRMGLGFLSSFDELQRPIKKLDIVHTELLTLHFGKTGEKFSASEIVSHSLFADGFVKYSLYHESDIIKQQKTGLKILSMKEVIIPDSQEAMTLNLGAKKIEMTLSKDVPMFIKTNIKSFIAELFENAGFDFEKEKDQIFSAIHPGGPKILQFIQEELGLSDQQLKHSYDVLYQNGNMTSSTAPCIWKEVIDDNSIKKGTLGFSVAFGPGLTATALLFKKI